MSLCTSWVPKTVVVSNFVANDISGAFFTVPVSNVLFDVGRLTPGLDWCLVEIDKVDERGAWIKKDVKLIRDEMDLNRSGPCTEGAYNKYYFELSRRVTGEGMVLSREPVIFISSLSPARGADVPLRGVMAGVPFKCVSLQAAVRGGAVVDLGRASKDFGLSPRLDGSVGTCSPLTMLTMLQKGCGDYVMEGEDKTKKKRKLTMSSSVKGRGPLERLSLGDDVTKISQYVRICCTYLNDSSNFAEPFEKLCSDVWPEVAWLFVKREQESLDKKLLWLMRN